MYNSREGGGGGGGSSANYNNDSKYVADILSSMANGDPVPANQYTLPSFVCGVTTATTPTLTPTTLANIEQAFIELQSVPVSTANQDPLTQSGFVPPIVDPVCSTDHIAAERYKYDSDDPDWEPSSKRVKTSPGPSKSTPTDYQATSTTKKSGARRPLKVEKLSPEEEQRRRVRRERNKVAAAKCRQRRVDHTNQLITETEKLEDEKVSLEDEIQALQQQKDQLEFILQAHQPLCKVEKKLSQQQSEQRKIKNEMDAASQCSRKPDALPSRPNSLPLVKQEKDSRAHVAPNGLPISMHHNGYFNFSTLDSIVDNVSTGLTPVNGPSCASQVHRSSSDSGSEALGSPTLISL